MTPFQTISFDEAGTEGPVLASAWPWSEFVAGPENALARVAFESVLTSPGERNPVVFCGATGVGKSLLLDGLARRWRQLHPERKTAAVSGADFARGYAHAVKTDTVAHHRTRLTQASLLLFDGLEELAKKPAAQQELIHTLDAALAEGVQIVVASREPLTPGGAFLPALASRLSAGLVAPVAPPGPQARRAIVEKLASQSLATFDPLALDVLAEEFSATAGELRGAVLQLATEAQDRQAPVDVAAVRRFLEKSNEQRRPTVGKIAVHVARRFRLKAADLQGKTRRREVVQARGVAMLLARRLTGASYQAVGRHFGGRDHSTVMHACRRIAAQLNSDPALKRTFEELASPWTC